MKTNSEETHLLAILMDEVHCLYHRYGATEQDFNGRSRMHFISAMFLKELRTRPGLVEQLYDAPQARSHFIMQTLLEMASEQARPVETPLGTLAAYPKHSGSDSSEDFSGVYIDLRRKATDDLMLACVEWLPEEKELQVCVYKDGMCDEPIPDPIHYINLDAE